MNLMKTFILFTCLAIASCNSTKNAVAEEAVTTEEMSDKTDMETTIKNAQQMLADGYIRGVIIVGKGEGACEYYIDIKGGFAEQKVDPMNLPDSFKNDSEKVWLKFTGLRRANRCPDARPVEITEILKRAE